MTITEQANKEINIFMGWYIEVETTEDYPTQEWHTTKNKNHDGLWDSGKCVRLNEPNIEENRTTIDNELWKTLCRDGSSRGGDYSTSWNALMPVIQAINALDGADNSVELNKQIDRVIHLTIYTPIDVAFYVVSSFASWYNDQEINPQKTTTEFEYKGFMCDEAQEFFDANVESEERNGCGVVGSFVKLANGKTHLPSKGDMFTKHINGTLSVKSIHR